VWHFDPYSSWDNRLLLYLVAMLVALSAIGTSIAFKWYKLLVIQEHAEQVASRVAVDVIMAPSHLQPYSTAHEAEPQHPPPYSDKPASQPIQGENQESNMPPPYSRFSPGGPDTPQTSQSQHQDV